MSQPNWFAKSVENSWYRSWGWTWLLWPLSLVFRLLTRRRYRPRRNAPDSLLPAPVIVIGNLSVGGTGKTPLIIALVKSLQKSGFKPGVISRGYGGKADQYPCRVTNSSTACEVGDEPLLIAAFCPVVVSPQRIEAAHHLLKTTDCNVILSDDGLQHYDLPRDIEVVVVDGQRGLGNGQCLPAGPLREPPSRLTSVDMVVINQSGATGVQQTVSKYIDPNRVLASAISPVGFRRLLDHKAISLDDFSKSAVNAVAGIGNPQRFVTTLEGLGLQPVLHSYPDHYAFKGSELVFEDDLPVIVTAKDAVKFDPRILQKISDPQAAENIWVLDVEAVPEQAFFDGITDRLKALLANETRAEP